MDGHSTTIHLAGISDIYMNLDQSRGSFIGHQFLVGLGAPEAQVGHMVVLVDEVKHPT
jgi:hypothetical protein